MHPVVAIDGPSASGKSTVARAVAARLGFVYVDTGAMYRAATWRLLGEGIDPHDAAAVAAFAERMPFRCEVEGGATAPAFEAVVDAAALRSPRVAESVSVVARSPSMRARLVAAQRALRERAPLVMEGRDIGTVVFPDTPFKFYLDARPEVRAARRAEQGEQDAITRRDALDQGREVSPLKVAADAVVVDNSVAGVEAVIESVMERLRAGGLREAAGR